MKKFHTIMTAAAVLTIAVISFSFAQDATKEEKNGMLRHVVFFKFKESATEEQVKGVEEAFASLQNDIPTIVSYEAGTNVSPEGLDKGFTHAFILTFKTAKDRDAYLPHPAHKAFGSKLGPVLEDVCVIDFWTK